MADSVRFLFLVKKNCLENIAIIQKANNIFNEVTVSSFYRTFWSNTKLLWMKAATIFSDLEQDREYRNWMTVTVANGFDNEFLYFFNETSVQIINHLHDFCFINLLHAK